VKNYDNPNAPAFYQKEQELRRLVYQHLKRHADFCGMMARLLAANKPAEVKQVQQPKGEKPGKK
jgi:hypothetical protein